MKNRTVWTLLLAMLAVCTANAQQVQVQEHVLPNGMKLLMVPREGDPNVAAGWIAKAGSVNERPGITGISHLFEHMMFKGSRVIGTTNIEEDLKLMARMDTVKAELRTLEQEQLRRFRLGEIADLTDPKSRTPRHQALIDEMAQLDKAQKALLVANEFDKIYTGAGASGMNAGTSQDYTVYFINVPANKLELWFWMESDRLLNPVFREFYAERDVVGEERRMRTDSTPTGKFEEEFEALFWSASPYGWPTVGWPSDLAGITREEALAYYDLNYSPNNLTACLVGDFDPVRAIALAERYFGRLKRNPIMPPPVRTREPAALAEKRMIAYAETNPEVEIRYHSVADGHLDEPALVVLGSLLNGRTGRLYKSLVLDQKVATGASAGQNGLKWEGYFSLQGVAKPGGTPEQVEQALYQEVEKLQNTPVDDHELQKIKNRFAADTFRRLQSNFSLMLQLLVADSNRGWQSFNDDPKRFDAVTADDVQLVARKYLTTEGRTVALYYTKKSEAPPPTDDAATDAALLADLNDEERDRVRQMRGMIDMLPPDQAKAMLEKIQQETPPGLAGQKKVLDVIVQLLQRRIQGGR